MKTVKELVVEWNKECERNCTDNPPYPKGLNFFEGSAVDIRAFKVFMQKNDVPESEYYIEKDCVNFRA